MKDPLKIASEFNNFYINVTKALKILTPSV